MSLEMLQSAEQQQDMGAGACYNAAVYLLFPDTLRSLGSAAGQSIVQLLQDRVDAGAPVSSEGADRACPCWRCPSNLVKHLICLCTAFETEADLSDLT